MSITKPISADDPDAIQKLEDKLKKLQDLPCIRPVGGEKPSELQRKHKEG